MKTLALYLFVFLHTHFCGCGKDQKHSGAQKLRKAYTIKQIARLPAEITESSGFVFTPRGTLLTHNDGGSPAELFEVSLKGELLSKRRVETIRNRDWEDLARDTSGHLYIGDFGNNQNLRKDLTIYKVHEETDSLIGEINFRFPDQTSFPAPKPNRNFDCEAMIWHNGSLHLFSKDRSGRHISKHYTLPDEPGQYQATLIDSVRLNTMITGAAISPDKQTFALLGYGKIFLFPLASGKPFFQNRPGCISFSLSAQAEAITFINNTNLVIANEQGKLFLLRKKE